MKYILPVICFIIVVAGFWVSGFDFNERGEQSAAVYCITVFFVVVGFIFGAILDYDPRKEEEPKLYGTNPPPKQP